MTTEREVAGLIPGAEAILRVLKKLRNDSIPFALQEARPSHGSGDHINGDPDSSRLIVGDVNIVSPVSTFVLNTLTLT